MFPIMEAAAAGWLIGLWFALVVVLWVGYFFLEGFDYGVAMLLPILGKKDKDRRVMINTIGPVWDGNEVWLLTAGGATFAAFPGWYSSLFSALYLPLLLVLLGLILRGVAFEYRAKRDSESWRAAFDWCATIGSFLPALVFGVGLANFVKGLPVGSVEHNGRTLDFLFQGTFLGLFTPFTLLGGVMLVVVCLAHGAIFLALKTKGEIQQRAEKLSFSLAAAAAVLVLLFVLWAMLDGSFPQPQWPVVLWVTGIVSALCFAGAAFLVKGGREGWAFIAGGLGIAMLVATVFLHLWPNLGFITQSGKVLDATSAASSNGTLTIMTIAAVIFVPIVLAYQAWTYWVFRKRIGTQNLPVEAAGHTVPSNDSQDPIGMDAADPEHATTTDTKVEARP